MNFSNVSLTESSYILNSYIEESFSDLQVRCLRVDRQSLQESGMRYFTEDNSTGKEKLLEKIKKLFTTIWEGIVSIFRKIKTFFSDLVTDMKIKKLDDGYKQYVEKISDDDIKEIVKDSVKKYYKTELFGHAMVYSVKYYDYKNGKYKKNLYTEEEVTMENPKDIDEISKYIDRHHILDSAFGGFKEQYKKVNDAYKEIEKAFNEFAKGITDEVTEHSIDSEGSIALNYKPVKDALKELSAYTAAYCRMVIHNSKQLVSVVLKISTKYRKDYK